MPDQVKITEAAIAIVDQLKATHGPLMFHISGGCCDGSAPMCFAAGEFYLGSRDLHIGTVEDCPVYIAEDTYTYYKKSAITIDATKGRGASFSLEIPLGMRFLLRSELLKND